MLITAVQQSDLILYTHIHTHTFFFIFFSIYGLPQDIEYSSLGCTVGPCVSIIYIYQFASANPIFPVQLSPTLPFPWQPWWGFHICKPIQGVCIRYYYLDSEMGAKARDMGEGSAH